MELHSQPSHSANKVSYIFDEMAEEYDDLRDLWYAWRFSRLHFLIAEHILSDWEGKPNRVLDIGCGTGFQSYLYALTGAHVSGIDIAERLVSVAREKGKTFRKRFPCPLFPVHFDFVAAYNEKISKILQPRFSESPLVTPSFEVGDAVRLPFEDESFDHVNCCGSTLNYIDNHNAAILEMARVLKPGGTFVIEVDAKYNLDLIWPIIDSTLLRGALGYETTAGEALKALLSSPSSHITIDYPFGEASNPVYMDLKVFEMTTLLKELRSTGLRKNRIDSIHSVTNLIPSTFLDTAVPGRYLKRFFGL